MFTVRECGCCWWQAVKQIQLPHMYIKRLCFRVGGVDRRPLRHVTLPYSSMSTDLCNKRGVKCSVTVVGYVHDVVATSE